MQSAQIPLIQTYLPDLPGMADGLAEGCQTGRLADWQAFALETRRLFTPERMAAYEQAAPGWRAMAACAGGVTLVHMGAIFASLVRLPEYQQAPPDLQQLSWWVALFHDIAKRVEPGQRDHTHGFRSAAAAALALPRLGFPLRPSSDHLLAGWASQTAAAVARRADSPHEIQDNRLLPEILAGLAQIFGAGTPAALIVQAVLLHMSINVVSEWPQAAPLSLAEARRYVGPELLPLLKIITLVDSDAWALFTPQAKRQQRQETLAAFALLTGE